MELTLRNVKLSPNQGNKLIRAIKNRKPITFRVGNGSLEGNVPILVTSATSDKMDYNIKRGKGMNIPLSTVILKEMGPINKGGGSSNALTTKILKAIDPVSTKSTTLKGLINKFKKNDGAKRSRGELREMIETDHPALTTYEVTKIIDQVKKTKGAALLPQGAALLPQGAALLPEGGSLRPAGQFGGSLRPAGQFGGELPNRDPTFSALSSDYTVPHVGNYMTLTPEAMRNTMEIFAPDERDLLFTTTQERQGGFGPAAIIPMIASLIPEGIKLVKDIIGMFTKKKKGGESISDAELVSAIRKHKGGATLPMATVGSLVDAVRALPPQIIGFKKNINPTH